ncbi:MAG: hypothetical protein MHMPM18_003890 [Marteilia pararefringens]
MGRRRGKAAAAAKSSPKANSRDSRQISAAAAGSSSALFVKESEPPRLTAPSAKQRTLTQMLTDPEARQSPLPLLESEKSYFSHNYYYHNCCAYFCFV